MAASTGPPSAVRRRTRRVVGRRRPASSATIPSVSVSRAPVRLPRWFRGSRCRAGSDAHDSVRAAAGPTRNVTAPRTADEAAEDRVAVEVRHAHPVDRSVRRDERGGAGVADQPVVADRSRARRRAFQCAVSSRPSATPNARCETIATAAFGRRSSGRAVRAVPAPASTPGRRGPTPCGDALPAEAGRERSARRRRAPTRTARRATTLQYRATRTPRRNRARTLHRSRGG